MIFFLYQLDKSRKRNYSEDTYSYRCGFEVDPLFVRIITVE